MRYKCLIRRSILSLFLLLIFLPKYLHKVVDLPVDLDDLFILAEVEATPAEVVEILLPPSSVRFVIVQDIQP